VSAILLRLSFFPGFAFLNPKDLKGETRMRIRPLEAWVFSLFLAMAGVAVYHQYMANERANAPVTPYSVTIKAQR
jgi:hypothetical protein